MKAMMRALRCGRLPGAFGLLALSLALTSRVSAQQQTDRPEWSVSGYLEAEGRAFFEDAPSAALAAGESPERDGSFSFAAAPEVSATWGEGRGTFVFQPFGRWDSSDSRRTHADIRELYAQWLTDGFQLRVGLSKVFWGAAESQHLVDIVNQTDFVENIDTEDKLGQPMVWLSTGVAGGTLDLFYLPYSRPRTFPGADGRIRGYPHVDAFADVYEADAAEWYPTVAAHYSRTLDRWDLGVGLFHGTARTPDLIPQPFFEPLIPRYPLIEQASLDLSYTGDALQLNAEALVQSGGSQTFTAAVAGGEYTWFGALGSRSDIGVLAEVYVDSRGSDAPTVFDRDLFLGTRLALNDIAGTQLLGGVFIDLERGSHSARIEFERRLTDHTAIEIELQTFSADDPTDALSAYDTEDFVQIALRRYF